MTRAAVNCVVLKASHNKVGAVAAIDRIVARGQRDPVVAIATKDDVITGLTIDRVVAVSTDQKIKLLKTIASAEQEVITAATENHIGIFPATYLIVSSARQSQRRQCGIQGGIGIAEQQIPGGLQKVAGEVVDVAEHKSVAQDDVRTSASCNKVITMPADDQIKTTAAVDDVVAIAAFDVIADPVSGKHPIVAGAGQGGVTLHQPTDELVGDLARVDLPGDGEGGDAEQLLGGWVAQGEPVEPLPAHVRATGAAHAGDAEQPVVDGVVAARVASVHPEGALLQGDADHASRSPGRGKRRSSTR